MIGMDFQNLCADDGVEPLVEYAVGDESLVFMRGKYSKTRLELDVAAASDALTKAKR